MKNRLFRAGFMAISVLVLSHLIVLPAFAADRDRGLLASRLTSVLSTSGQCNRQACGHRGNGRSPGCDCQQCSSSSTSSLCFCLRTYYPFKNGCSRNSVILLDRSVLSGRLEEIVENALLVFSTISPFVGARVERLAKPVANDVEGGHCQKDGHARKDH